MNEIATIWARTFESLGFPSVPPSNVLRVGSRIFPYAFYFEQEDVFFGLQESFMFPLFFDNPGTPEDATIKILVGDETGKVRWLIHPRQPDGGRFFLLGCEQCTAEAFSTWPEGICEVCGKEQFVVADTDNVHRCWHDEQRRLDQRGSKNPPLLAPANAEKVGLRDGSGLSLLKRDLARPPRVHLWPEAEAVDNLISRYPNFHEVGELILRELALSKSRKDPAIRLPRLLLVGSPSCGKSSFVDELAKILVGEDRMHLDFGHQIPYFALVGSDSAFREAKPGRIVQLLAGPPEAGPIRNPMLVLDEIDKIGERSEWNALPALLSVLDERESETFMDEFLDTPVDASGLLVIGIANDGLRLPSPLKSRFVEFHIPDYSLDQLVDTVVPSVYQMWRSAFWEGTFPDELSRETRKHIVHLSDGVPRKFSRTIGDLAAAGYRELFPRPTFESITKEHHR